MCWSNPGCRAYRVQLSMAIFSKISSSSRIKGHRKFGWVTYEGGMENGDWNCSNWAESYGIQCNFTPAFWLSFNLGKDPLNPHLSQSDCVICNDVDFGLKTFVHWDWALSRIDTSLQISLMVANYLDRWLGAKATSSTSATDNKLAGFCSGLMVIVYLWSSHVAGSIRQGVKEVLV